MDDPTLCDFMNLAVSQYSCSDFKSVESHRSLSKSPNK